MKAPTLFDVLPREEARERQPTGSGNEDDWKISLFAADEAMPLLASDGLTPSKCVWYEQGTGLTLVLGQAGGAVGEPLPGVRTVVAGIEVEVVRKDVRQISITVVPPGGDVRVALPLAATVEMARLAVVRQLPWIRRMQAELAEQARTSPHDYAEAESHYFLGRRYRLRIEESADESVSVQPVGISYLRLVVRPGSTQATRGRLLSTWLRGQLEQRLSLLVPSWAARLNVATPSWTIRAMRTRWGSCVASSRRLLFHPELIQKPEACIDYVVLHELLHLIEPTHSRRFFALLNAHMPGWETVERDLNHQTTGTLALRRS